MAHIVLLISFFYKLTIPLQAVSSCDVQPVALWSYLVSDFVFQLLSHPGTSLLLAGNQTKIRGCNIFCLSSQFSIFSSFCQIQFACFSTVVAM